MMHGVLQAADGRSADRTFVPACILRILQLSRTFDSLCIVRYIRTLGYLTMKSNILFDKHDRLVFLILFTI